tara:strand:+ start:1013 stop:1603 length:591 start_codon:yes stop_codon:yes gene_type:complete
MFNGIIFNKGIVHKIKKSSKGVNIFIKSNLKVKRKDIGISICCDGVCLTMVSFKNKIKEFYLLNETINRSKFKNVSLGDKINLELPLKYGQKISGHMCQGHVDCTSKINKIINKGKSRIYDFKIDKNNLSYLIPKASILLNGVSLTISKVTKNGFQVWLIPHSLKLTNLADLKKGQLVNVEIDILSKYIKKYYGKK